MSFPHGFNAEDENVTDGESNPDFASILNELSASIHQRNVAVGWYKNTVTGDNYKPSDTFFVASKILLIHSEISEANEGHRKDLMDDHLKHRKAFEVELADAMIRIFDLAGFLNLDLGGALVEKLVYNAKRADHKLENRTQEGGKAY